MKLAKVWLALLRAQVNAVMQSPCPLLSVRPCRNLVDQKVQILVRNLGVKQQVTLHCLHRSEDGDLWEAFGQYVSDHQGAVTVAKDASVGGTYKGVESMGLLWSLRPVPGSRKGLRLRKKDMLTPMVFHVSVYNGHVTQGFAELTPMVKAVMERYYIAPGVKRVDVYKNKIRGTLFIPPGPGPFPGVLDMWGGGGGLVEYRAALLASHGFVGLALMYLSPVHADTEDIGISYFEEAFQILQDHPMVLRDRVAVIGLSFGAAITYNIAANSKVIKPRCCVCFNGSHAVPIADSVSEVFQGFLRDLHKTRMEDNQLVWRDIILPIPTDITLKVDVGKIRCPLLVIVSGDDQNWPSLESSKDIEQLMEKAGNRHLLQILIYHGAGHLIEPPYTPHHRASNFMVSATDKVMMLWGGQTKPHADAQEDSWEKMLAFLQQHLYNASVQARL